MVVNVKTLSQQPFIYHLLSFFRRRKTARKNYNHRKKTREGSSSCRHWTGVWCKPMFSSFISRHVLNSSIPCLTSHSSFNVSMPLFYQSRGKEILHCTCFFKYFGFTQIHPFSFPVQTSHFSTDNKTNWCFCTEGKNSLTLTCSMEVNSWKTNKLLSRSKVGIHVKTKMSVLILVLCSRVVVVRWGGGFWMERGCTLETWGWGWTIVVINPWKHNSILI